MRIETRRWPLSYSVTLLAFIPPLFCDAFPEARLDTGEIPRKWPAEAAKRTEGCKVGTTVFEPLWPSKCDFRPVRTGRSATSRSTTFVQGFRLAPFRDNPVLERRLGVDY